jgi:hypothetical protein
MSLLLDLKDFYVRVFPPDRRLEYVLGENCLVLSNHEYLIFRPGIHELIKYLYSQTQSGHKYQISFLYRRGLCEILKALLTREQYNSTQIIKYPDNSSVEVNLHRYYGDPNDTTCYDCQARLTTGV